MRDAAAGRLQITVEPDDGAVVLRAEGEVDLETAEKLAAALRSAAAGGDRVVADLIGVPFMDSSGLKVLLQASDQIGERLALALGPGSPVAHLLELAEVRERFEVHATAADAISAGRDG
jgi:anti-anti-sigma factor